MLTAASSNTDTKTIEFLLLNGSSINETGFVQISNKRKNLVNSNAIGAAAVGGKKATLVYLLSKMSKSATEYEATEELDRSGEKTNSAKLQKECYKYTPLMLNITSA